MFSINVYADLGEWGRLYQPVGDFSPADIYLDEDRCLTYSRKQSDALAPLVPAIFQHFEEDRYKDPLYAGVVSMHNFQGEVSLEYGCYTTALGESLECLIVHHAHKSTVDWMDLIDRFNRETIKRISMADDIWVNHQCLKANGDLLKEADRKIMLGRKMLREAQHDYETLARATLESLYKENAGFVYVDTPLHKRILSVLERRL